MATKRTKIFKSVPKPPLKLQSVTAEDIGTDIRFSVTEGLYVYLIHACLAVKFESCHNGNKITIKWSMK